MTVATDHWPDDIKLDVLPPLAILKRQNSLSAKTKGLLDVEVSTITLGQRVQHQLDLIARPLRYRQRLLTAEHDAGMPYPVAVVSEALADWVRRREVVTLPDWDAPPMKVVERATQHLGDIFRKYADGYETPTFVAATDAEFDDAVREVLTSPYVRGLISSLLIRIRSETEPVPQQPSTSDEPSAKPRRGRKREAGPPDTPPPA